MGGGRGGAGAEAVKETPDTRSERAYRQLRREILQRVHAPGARLDVQALARRMAISTAPLRDAVRRLEADGLVRIHPRYGTFVTSVTPEEVREAYEVRTWLELAAGAKAAVLLDPAQLDSLSKILEAQQRALEGASLLDYDQFLGLDAAFHLGIIEGAHNRRLVRLYEGLQAHMQVARAKYVAGPDRGWQALREHLVILSALRRRAPERVKTALLAHLLASEEDLLAHITPDPGGPPP
jgi:DNA-binding GntR family transcriptional regulator